MWFVMRGHRGTHSEAQFTDAGDTIVTLLISGSLACEVGTHIGSRTIDRLCLLPTEEVASEVLINVTNSL